uniref:trypsin n=1 Tax=Neogobius melanostomus TaxID=47308 RepID=A0A8C6WQ00_9GOBI
GLSQAHYIVLMYLLLHMLIVLYASNIINGGKVPDDSMQFMASLQYNKTHECGGFLISEDLVLTAAHCNETNSVVLGTHHLSSATDDMRYDVKKMCRHPNFKKTYLGNDIMILKLSRKAQGSIQIIDRGSVSGTSCQVAGWGYASAKRTPVNDLQQIFVQIVTDKVCKKKWGNGLPHSTICAGGMNTGKGICQGDSGGPLVCNNKAVGIVNGLPNVYTNISEFSPWIDKIVEKGDC